ncbi:hypothetical protein D3C71_1035430 [compost metagenome]
MDYFDGVTPEQCWRNDLLNELRELNRNLRKSEEAVPVEDKPEGDDSKHENDTGVVQGERGTERVRGGKRGQSSTR